MSAEEQKLSGEFEEILLFLAEGLRGNGSLGERAWVIIHGVRPELLGGTTQTYAKNKYGFRQADLSNLVAEFEVQFPRFKATQNWRERKRVWMAANPSGADCVSKSTESEERVAAAPVLS